MTILENKALLGLLLLSTLVLAPACSNPQGPPLCVPGHRIACTCTDGRMGAQACAGDGSYGECVCEGNNPGSGDGGFRNPDMMSGTGKRIFVTSLRYAASAAKSVCQNVAGAASLGGQWKAWLSTGFDDAIDNISSNGPWKRIDGQVAFKNRAQLATLPDVPLTVTEQGTMLSTVDPLVWTGTLTGGTNSGSDCSDWLSNSSGNTGTAGDPESTASWTQSTMQPCNLTYHVYCLED